MYVLWLIVEKLTGHVKFMTPWVNCFLLYGMVGLAGRVAMVTFVCSTIHHKATAADWSLHINRGLTSFALLCFVLPFTFRSKYRVPERLEMKISLLYFHGITF